VSVEAAGLDDAGRVLGDEAVGWVEDALAVLGVADGGNAGGRTSQVADLAYRRSGAATVRLRC
jgi:hypothetical protein